MRVPSALVLLCIAGTLPVAFGQDPPPPPKLDPQTFDRYLGTYRFDSGRLLVVSRTERRLYVYEPVRERIRGLERLDDRTWVAGPSLLVYGPEAFRLTFLVGDTGAVRGLLYREGGAEPRPATKVPLYREEPVTFRNGGVVLAGTLFLPATAGPHPAVVLGHGSGPQDRNGYVSNIRLMADHLARHGIAALTYDKRGVGASTGSWANASFADLAADLIAGIRLLRERRDIDSHHVGAGGSSQIGWIAAKATTLMPDIAFVFLVSAGGSGYSVEQQNLYNIGAEMRAKGVEEAKVRRALDQQRQFFEVLHRGQGAEARDYDAATRALREDAELRDWLLPLSTEIDWADRSQWFTALEIDFDPLPAWRSYRGPVLGVFGELDAQTPVADVVPRFTGALMSRKGTDFTVTVFGKASHLMMEATVPSDDELPRLDRFVPGFYDQVSDWLWGRLERDGLRRHR
jgi:X-Pro dipeptidyl-peptidase-like protein